MSFKKLFDERDVESWGKTSLVGPASGPLFPGKGALNPIGLVFQLHVLSSLTCFSSSPSLSLLLLLSVPYEFFVVRGCSSRPPTTPFLYLDSRKHQDATKPALLMSIAQHSTALYRETLYKLQLGRQESPTRRRSPRGRISTSDFAPRFAQLRCPQVQRLTCRPSPGPEVLPWGR